MRDTGRINWQQWRITKVESAAESTCVVPFARQLLCPTAISAEEPGPDGIRHELVARVRREIEAGTYEMEESWLAAEERLLDRVAAGC
jgi:hypothetical protein